MAHFDMSWLFLGISAVCIAIVGKNFAKAHWIGIVSSIAGIAWAVINNDYGLVPFNAILLVIALLETRKNIRMAKKMLHLENAKAPAKKAKPVARRKAA